MSRSPENQPGQEPRITDEEKTEEIEPLGPKLGRRIREIREIFGINQNYLAEMASSPQSSICQLEKEVIQNPRHRLVASLAGALRISAYKLVDMNAEIQPTHPLLPSLDDYLSDPGVLDSKKELLAQALVAIIKLAGTQPEQKSLLKVQIQEPKRPNRKALKSHREGQGLSQGELAAKIKELIPEEHQTSANALQVYLSVFEQGGIKNTSWQRLEGIEKVLRMPQGELTSTKEPEPLQSELARELKDFFLDPDVSQKAKRMVTEFLKLLQESS